MKIRILFLALFLALFSLNCSKNNLSTGKYFPSLPMEGEKYFIHTVENKNSLKKLIDGSYNYYSWKTIEYNETIKNEYTNEESCFSFYKTILNEEIKKFELDKLRYINQPGHLLINNLYFIDDNRCIYVSFDDERTNYNFEPHIPLYLDDKNYKPVKETLKRFQQYLRGYYSIDGDDIFIHFENPNSADNFLVNAKIIDKKIEFTSMTVPNSPNDLYKDGYNTEYIDFEKIFYIDARPIFEWVAPIKDIVYPPESHLTLGFENYNLSGELNELHEELLQDNNGITKSDTLMITNIVYKKDQNGFPYREYSIKKNKFGASTIIIKEEIGLNASQEPVKIPTW